ncbi:MAG: penicillin-binding protein 2 [Steroidobacteraceae bacterium]
MVRRVRIKDHWGEQRIFALRSIVAAVCVGLLLLTVASRLFYLQVLRHEYYAELSQGNRVRTDPIPPSRGLIFDRHGVVLAENLPAFQLELVREQVGGTPQIDATLAHLVAIGLLEAEEVGSIKRTILSHHVYESVPIKLQLDDQEMARFAVHRYEFTGVDIRTRLSRHYPFGPMAVHALGYVAAISEQDLKHIDSSAYAGTTLIGKLGVEGAYENLLHGSPGYREVLVNAAGRPVERQGAYTPKLDIRPPVAGADLILSLDMRVQRAAEEALAGKRGAAIAIDPGSGDVVALASTPGFDPNAFARGLTTKQYDALQTDIDKPLINRALRGAYPPGSTVKPFFALASLKYGAMTAEQTIFCPGHFNLPGSAHRFRDWKPKGHGIVAMRHAIMQSCDVYFYTVANKLGIDRMHDFMSTFGFGEATGIDIPGEKAGLMPSTEWKRHAYKRAAEQVWYPGETISVGIGQGYMTATPMQLAHAVSGIASRGQIFKPRLVTAVRAAGSTTATSRPVQQEPSLTAVSAEQWEVIVEGMELATGPGGTAAAATAGSPYKIAGKTGSAQVFTVGQNEKYNEKQVSERNLDHALFISFAPAENPKLAVAVFVENGKHGGSTAAPIARKMFDAYLLPEKSPAVDLPVVRKAL